MQTVLSAEKDAEEVKEEVRKLYEKVRDLICAPIQQHCAVPPKLAWYTPGLRCMVWRDGTRPDGSAPEHACRTGDHS